MDAPVANATTHGACLCLPSWRVSLSPRLRISRGAWSLNPSRSQRSISAAGARPDLLADRINAGQALPLETTTESTHHLSTFTDLELAEPILRALAAEGYVTPTPIQAMAIPHIKSGADLLGIAQTGTGKTAAFALPILDRLAATRRPPLRKGCRALILSPTRELATQIADSFRSYGRHLGITVAVVFGGVGHRPQVAAMARGVDVLVATPGRLLDHVGERDIDLRGTEIFVLDEADQMLDLGFVKPIRRIVSELAQRRQNLFFSATMPGEIERLADDLLRDPVKVAVTPAAKTVDLIDQKVIHVQQPKKRSLLARLLADAAITRALVFTRTKRGADRVAEHLEQAGISAVAIHGNKSQSQRERALDAFKSGRTRVMVATDIAARGIDIDQVSHVFQFELPEVPEAYVHRIGRTARAGASGVAIALCDEEERGLLRDIERVIRQRIPAESRLDDDSLGIDAKAGQGRPLRGRQEGRARPSHGGDAGGAAKRHPSSGRHGPRSPATSANRGGERAQGSWSARGDREEIWSNHGRSRDDDRRPERVRSGPSRPSVPSHAGRFNGRAEPRGRRAR